MTFLSYAWAAPILFLLFGNAELRFEVGGRTMGTTWQVIYFDKEGRDLQRSIDSLLIDINAGINHYDVNAEISKFNRAEASHLITSIHFERCLTAALEIARASGGAFDPTVMPLVRAWGFNGGRSDKPSHHTIDSILHFVGYEKILVEGDHVSKTDVRVQLDFGGIGQGYAVDVIAEYLRSHAISNFLIELGGEGFASGQNLTTNSQWTVGIVDPRSAREDQQLYGYVLLEDQAFTTSGNYFNYRIVEGKKIGHTIDAKSGAPVQHDVLSASVFGSSCTKADAWATALMTMEADRSRKLLRARADIAAILLYEDNNKLLHQLKSEHAPQLHLINSDHDR